MACFVVPLTQAVATTIYRRKMQKNPANANNLVLSHMPRLEAMLWGGSAMLIVDHIISGELMPMFPFFSALTVEGGAYTMLREMLTVGLPMSALVTAIWGVTVYVASRKSVKA